MVSENNMAKMSCAHTYRHVHIFFPHFSLMTTTQLSQYYYYSHLIMEIMGELPNLTAYVPILFECSAVNTDHLHHQGGVHKDIKL